MAANADTIRRIYAAIAEGDVGPLADRMHEDIEWHEPPGAPVISGTFRGRATVLREVLLRTAEVWDRFHVEPERFIERDDLVIVTGRLDVVARGTGGSASAPFAHVWELCDGRILRWQCFTDTALLQNARTSR